MSRYYSLGKSNKKSKLILCVIVLEVLLVCFYISVSLSHHPNTDFGVVYSTANKILDSNAPYISIYDIDTTNKYSIPEAIENTSFPYSIPAAYMMAPLALMPYFVAKSFMIFLNILMYLAAIAIALRLGGASKRWFAYPLAMLCLWLPFILNMRLVQINAIILFLIAIAVFAASKNRPTLCGIFLAIATLFKLFPIGIAMLLGIKNWRIFASCLFVFVISFLIPDSLKWFEAINNYPRYYKHYNPIYLFLKQYGLVWFLVYASSVAGCSALLAYRAKNEKYAILASFAIPSVFLTMPIIEYAHLTILSFSYAFLIVSSKRSNWLLLISIFISFLMISLSLFSDELLLSMNVGKFIGLLGLSVFWVALAYNLFGVPLFENQKADISINTHILKNGKR